MYPKFMSPKVFTFCESTIKDISTHLNELEPKFHQLLVQRVNLDEYVDKLKRQAKTIEYWEDKRLVGLIAFYINEASQSIFISNFTIVQDRVSQGIGKELFVKLIEESQKTLIAFKIELEVQKKNSNAIKFYQGLGFSFTSAKDDYILMSFYHCICKL